MVKLLNALYTEDNQLKLNNIKIIRSIMMKKTNSIISIATCAAAVMAVVPFSASAAEGDVVYGTMNIPYADFYAAEINNAYEVDAVSSATASKWKNNAVGSVDESGAWKDGGIVAGTYNDDNGKILGVTYPVAASKDDVAALTEKYGFVQSDAEPAAYKEVSLDGDKLTVSAVKDTNGEQTVDGSLTLSTNSNYGDYQISVPDYPKNGDIYGVIVNTVEGDAYALRHLENIWRRGSYSWSAGFSTTEVHGNELSYEDYASSMGKNISSVKFITLDGVYTVNTPATYIPVKFNGTLTAENGKSGNGSTSYTITDFPSDYKPSASAAEGMTAADGKISYTNAKPGSYTVTVSDESGKYAPVNASFTLSTADIPVKYQDGKLVAADGFTQDDVANYIKNITTVTVNGTEYRNNRRGAIVVKTDDGSIDFDVKSGENNVFDGSGDYEITVNATGYDTAYTFKTAQAAVTTAAATTTAAKTTTTTAKATTTSTAKKTSNSGSPKTGVADAAIPAAVLALAGAAAFAMRKKND